MEEITYFCFSFDIAYKMQRDTCRATNFAFNEQNVHSTEWRVFLMRRVNVLCYFQSIIQNLLDSYFQYCILSPHLSPIFFYV